MVSPAVGWIHLDPVVAHFWVMRGHWLIAGHLGTLRMIFDQTGDRANMSRHDYLPLGEELFTAGG